MFSNAEKCRQIHLIATSIAHYWPLLHERLLSTLTTTAISQEPSMFVTSSIFIILYCGLSLMLCWCDYRNGLLPDRFTCPLLWVGLLYHLYLSESTLSSAVWGAIAGYVSFATIYWLYRGLRGYEGIGYGDVKFLAALGAWHGWGVLPQLVLIATILACVTLGMKIIAGRKRQVLYNPLPFGPFLAAAGLWCGWQTLISPPP